ncbi:MAG: glucose-6-phosphate isomerase [Deltaproteobacteria bacterium]|nr:glucose-6-phosphate isomerase [Deltaproteobacteria bacterium]
MPDYRRRTAREAMSVRLDVNGLMGEAIGAAGVGREEVDALAPRVSEVGRVLKARRSAGELPFYELPYEKDAVARVRALAAEVRGECDTLVVLGIGGSALGTRAIISALGPTAPRIIVADHVDPWSFGAVLDGLDLKRTTFNVISKSGETIETMAQFLIVRDLLLRSLGAVDYTKRVIITTDADQGALRQIVYDEGFRDLALPAGLSGRFSVLSSVGLLPAAVAGIKIDEMLAGAAWIDVRCQEADIWKNPGHLLGALLYLADTRHQQNILVMMPYSDRLTGFAAWFAQLWAESLAKAETLDGYPAFVGQTPLVAVGAKGQHSLLQLLMEGPVDKVVGMLRVEDHGRELPIASAYADLDSLGYLGGTGLGALLNRQQRATELSLLKGQRPVFTLALPQLNAFTLGQLFYLFEVAVVFAGGLYRVDPFNQPGIEVSKRLTYALMGRKGFDEARAEVDALLAAKRPEYIV